MMAAWDEKRDESGEVVEYTMLVHDTRLHVHRMYGLDGRLSAWFLTAIGANDLPIIRQHALGDVSGDEAKRSALVIFRKRCEQESRAFKERAAAAGRKEKGWL